MDTKQIAVFEVNRRGNTYTKSYDVEKWDQHGRGILFTSDGLTPATGKDGLDGYHGHAFVEYRKVPDSDQQAALEAVVNAAESFLEDDSDERFAELEKAVEAARGLGT